MEGVDKPHILAKNEMNFLIVNLILLNIYFYFLVYRKTNLDKI